MKKNSFYFKNGARLASLVLISSALSGLPSCSYDDDDLRISIDRLDDRLSNLELAISSMKTEIENVKIITDVLNSNGYVESVTEDANGNILVKFSNGKETLIQKGDNVSAPLITVKEEDGIHYWAKDIDGNVEFLLDGNNNKMPVSGVTPQIRINSISKEWETSVDNGNTWQSTGVIAALDNGVISAFDSISEDDDSVYFKFSSGTEIKIAKTKDLSLELIGGVQYFEEDETKVVELNMKGVFKYSLSKPDGWKVAVTSSGLSITAPAEGNIYAETSGKVAITAVSSDGKSVIAEMVVKLGDAPFSITVKDDNVEVVNSNPRYSYFTGICEASKFTVEYIESLLDEDCTIYRQSYDYDGAVSSLKGDEVVAGVNYIIWAVTDKMFYTPDIETITTQSYFKEPERSVSLELVSTTSLDATFKIDMLNCDQYYIGAVQGLGINVIMDIVTGFNKSQFLNSNPDIKLSQLKNDWGNAVSCTPSASYTVWAAPLKPGAYTEEDFVLVDVTLLAPDYTGTASVDFGEITTTHTSYEITMNPSSDAIGFYYAHKTESNLASFATDEDLIKNLMNYGNYSTESTFKTQTALNPGNTYYMCVVAVSEDGKIGPLVKKEITTKSLDFIGTATATCDIITKQTEVSVKMTPSGNVKEYRYFTMLKGELPYKIVTEDDIKNHLALDKYPCTIVTSESMTDNTFTIEKLNMETEYDMYMIVIDENENISPILIKEEFTTKFYTVVRANSADYKESAVNVVSCEWGGFANYYDLNYDVTLPENCVGGYVMVLDEGTYSAQNSVAYKDLMKYVIKNGAYKTGDDLKNLYKYGSVPSYVCVVAIIDGDTAYQTYSYKVEVPVTEPETGTDTENTDEITPKNN